MCSEQREAAQQGIDDADIPSTVYRTAMRLLHSADNSSGTVTVSEGDLMAICQTVAEGTLRSHLVQLASAGILRYRRRGLIYIQFDPWANPELPWEDEVLIAERSNRELGSEVLIAERSNLDNGDPIRALSDQNGEPESADLIAQRSITESEPPNRALSDQKPRAERSNLPSTSQARSGGWVGPLLPKKKRKKGPTHPPKPSQQLALGLLIDPEIGISYEVAQILAAGLPAQDIYRLVDEWLPEHRDGKVKTGALVSRLKRLVGSPWGADAPSPRGPVSLSAGFLVSDLFQRHRLPAEMIAEPPRRKYSVDEAYPDDYERRRKYNP